MGQAQGLLQKVDSNPCAICVKFVEDKVVIEQACIRIEFIYRRVSSGRTWQNVCFLNRQSTPNNMMWTGRMRGTTISHARPQITTRRTTYIYLPLSILVPNAERSVTIYPRGYTVGPLATASCDRISEQGFETCTYDVGRAVTFNSHLICRSNGSRSSRTIAGHGKAPAALASP